MLTDLRYALGQLRPIIDRNGPNRTFMTDRVQRAIDALERCLEAAEAQDALLLECEAEMDAEEADLAEAQSRGPGWTL